jgi:hypothetical protein
MAFTFEISRQLSTANKLFFCVVNAIQQLLAAESR